MKFEMRACPGFQEWNFLQPNRLPVTYRLRTTLRHSLRRKGLRIRLSIGAAR